MDRRLRQLVEGITDELAGDRTRSGPPTAEDVLTAVSARTGREIRLGTFPASSTLTGAVMCCAGVAYLQVREDLTGFHRDQVIYHEIAHLLAGHLDRTTAHADRAPTAIAAALPLLAAGAAERMLARACDEGHEDADEIEAEAIATLIATRLRRGLTDPFARELGRALE